MVCYASTLTDVNCNFDEKNTCGWINDDENTLNWKLDNGTAISFGLGPISDISKSGYYTFVDVTDYKQTTKVKLISPEFNETMSQNTRNDN